jgi:hypothetical protein
MASNPVQIRGLPDHIPPKETVYQEPELLPQRSSLPDERIEIEDERGTAENECDPFENRGYVQMMAPKVKRLSGTTGEPRASRVAGIDGHRRYALGSRRC